MSESAAVSLLTEPSTEALRPGPRSPDSDAPEVHRRRLLAGLVKAVAERGYANTTVGDVSRHAHVSRRTFYEQFSSKEECFLAAFDAAALILFDAVRTALDRHTAWPDRIATAVEAYLSTLAGAPDVARVFVLEALRAGDEAVARRRAVHERWATLLIEEIDAARIADPEMAKLTNPLTPTLALMVVEAQEGLILSSVERGETAKLPEHLEDVLVVFVSVLHRDSRSVARNLANREKRREVSQQVERGANAEPI